MAVFLKNFPPLILIGVVTNVPLIAWLFFLASDGSILDSTAQITIAELFTGALCHAMTIFAVFQYLRRRPVHALASMQRGIASLFAVLCVSAIVATLSFVGGMFLVLPGLLAAAVFSVAVPAAVVERCNPITALKRSVALTAGKRWPIVGAMLAIRLSMMLGAFMTGLAIRVEEAPFAFAAAVGTLDTLCLTFAGVLSAVIYHDLRVATEGIDIEQIAQAFD